MVKFTHTTLIALTVLIGNVAFADDASSKSAWSAKPKNILMIAIDDLNDWIGPLGGHPQVKTPALDRLAARGMTFTNAHCQATLCNPSRTSLLTGLRPGTTGVYGLSPWFRNVERLKDIESLPQHLRASGLRTLTCGKVYHGSYGRGPIEFDTVGVSASVGARPPQKLIGPTPGGNNPLMDWGTFPHRDEDKGDWQVASWATKQLQEIPADSQPFFLSAGFFLPHVPCYVTQSWYDMYPDETLVMPPILDGDRDDTPQSSWYIHWDLPEPRTSWLEQHDQLRPLVRSYLASISFVDSQVGRLLDALENSPHRDDTLVVLWSDHGYHLGEKAISGKNSLWQRSTRVPLLFAGPGIEPGSRCDQPVELLDIYPTLSNMIGSAPPAHLEGLSLAGLLLDPAAKRSRPAITTHNAGNHSIRDDHYRLIRYLDGAEEFYDCQIDPNEFNNQIANPQYASQIAALRKWIPQSDSPLAAGSADRILERRDDGVIYWENKPIVAGEAIK